MSDIRLGRIDGIFDSGMVRVAFSGSGTATYPIPLYSFDSKNTTPKIGDEAAVIDAKSGKICVLIRRVKFDED